MARAPVDTQDQGRDAHKAMSHIQAVGSLDMGEELGPRKTRNAWKSEQVHTMSGPDPLAEILRRHL